MFSERAQHLNINIGTGASNSAWCLLRDCDTEFKILCFESAEEES